MKTVLIDPDEIWAMIVQALDDRSDQELGWCRGPSLRTDEEAAITEHLNALRTALGLEPIES